MFFCSQPRDDGVWLSGATASGKMHDMPRNFRKGPALNGFGINWESLCAQVQWHSPQRHSPPRWLPYRSTTNLTGWPMANCFHFAGSDTRSRKWSSWVSVPPSWKQGWFQVQQFEFHNLGLMTGSWLMESWLLYVAIYVLMEHWFSSSFDDVSKINQWGGWFRHSRYKMMLDDQASSSSRPCIRCPGLPGRVVKMKIRLKLLKCLGFSAIFIDQTCISFDII